MKKSSFLIIIVLIFVFFSLFSLCYADENTIDENRIKEGYYLPSANENKFVNGYGIIQNSKEYTRSVRYGLIDKDYNVVVEPSYYLINFDYEYKNIIYAYVDIYARYGDIYKITDEGLKKINSEMYSMYIDFVAHVESAFGGFQNILCSVFSGDMLAVADKEYKHYGVIDKSGNFIIPFTDKYAYILDDPYIIRYERTGLWKTSNEIVTGGQLLNSRGEILTERKYDYIEILDDCIIVAKDGKENILAVGSYEELLDWSYVSLKLAGNYIIAQNLDKKFGIIDRNGNTVIDFGIYDDILWSSEEGFYSFYGPGYPATIIRLPGESDNVNETEESNSDPANIVELDASIPADGITLNGVKIENENRLYPFILYSNITYFPMTYHDSRFLNLKTQWNISGGLEIMRSDEYDEYWADTATEKNSYEIKVLTVDFDVDVNGKKIINRREPYPLLKYKDITYFPMTWRFCVDEFGWQYHYSKEEGLRINSRR